MLDQSEQSIALPDRRNYKRQRAGREPCCVMASDLVVMGVIRNFSFGGACIEVDADFQTDDQVRYFWAANCCMSGRIAWRDGTTYGVEHEDLVREARTALPKRAIRIPCEAEAECFIAGERYTALVENISAEGMRVSSLPETATDARLSISLCGVNLHNVQVRWFEQGRAGLSFADRLSRAALVKLLLDKRFALGKAAVADRPPGFGIGNDGGA